MDVHILVIPDQIGGIFMMAAAATHGDISITNREQMVIQSLTAKLLMRWMRAIEDIDWIRVIAQGERLEVLMSGDTSIPRFPNRYVAR